MALSLTDNDWQVFRNALGTNDSVANRIAALLDGSAAATRTGAQTWSAAGSFTSTLNVTGALTCQGGITFASGAQTLTVKANTASALLISDGTVSMLAFDSRNTVTAVSALLITPPAPTIAGAAGTVWNAVKVAARTLTDTTQTTVTNLTGTGLYIGATTIAQSGGAVTVSKNSALYIEVPIAGSSVTLSASYLVDTNVTGCFCTAGGVWTDVASSEAVKNDIEDATPSSIKGILGKIRPRTWKYDAKKIGHDNDRQRFGIVSQELPECFRIPGVDDDGGGLNGSILGSFGLAALSLLSRENDELKARIEKLEKRKSA
jgi:hypothetical protein